MNFTTSIETIQKQLGVTVDGKAGPETWSAIIQKVSGAVAAPAASDRVDDRSEHNIATLLPPVQPYARALVHAAQAVGIEIKVISGTRSYAEQDALYAKGRTIPNTDKVTNAKGGYSNHNFGIAFDIGVFEGTAYLSQSAKYKAVGALGMQLGLSWGGTWQTFHDEPHFELKPLWATTMPETKMVDELRRRKDAGTDAFA
jgi:peptidoglycan L-alanyl-D-glutamate endopeptidase CwlK